MKLSIEEMQLLAKEKKGKCLSVSYINSNEKLLWECEQGHQWWASPNKIKHAGQWCKKCSGKEKLTIELMQEIANSKGGKCLSVKYFNNETKLKWQCSKGHVWDAIPSAIKNLDQWCPTCAGRLPLSLVDLQELAKINNGQCLSKEFINSQTKLKWCCEKGHIFLKAPVHIKHSGSWCPKCAGKAKLTIVELQEFAKIKGGKLITPVYINQKQKLLWECIDGHQWYASATAIKNGDHWCPKCNSYLTEEKCRYIFEKLLEVPFPKNRKILKNFELDGYNETINIAFEFHGRQHYEFSPHFYKNQKEFVQRKIKDVEKIDACKNSGIALIIIPYYNASNDHSLFEFIKAKLREEKILFNQKISEINYNDFNISFSKIKEYKELAKKRGGECLSTVYLGGRSKLLWECKKGHQWEATPFSIKIGNSWCRICSGNEKISIEVLKKIALAKGGKCLSENLNNGKEKLLWECKIGHRWSAAARDVKNSDRWCPKCAGNQKYSIEDMQQIASDKGGKCLSVKYINLSSKLLWECKIGHQWLAFPNNIKNQNQWCPFCAKRRKLSIEEMQEIATKRGGKCLSKVYTNNKSKLLWECIKGHQWEATVNNIKNNNSWCPICISNK